MKIREVFLPADVCVYMRNPCPRSLGNSPAFGADRAVRPFGAILRPLPRRKNPLALREFKKTIDFVEKLFYLYARGNAKWHSIIKRKEQLPCQNLMLSAEPTLPRLS